MGYKVLKWDSRIEDKGKHGKFENLGRVLLGNRIP